MNSSIAAQRLNHRFFFISLFAAVLLVLLSIMLARSVMSGSTLGEDAATKECLSTLRTYGFNPEQKGNTLRAGVAAMDGYEQLVYKTEVIIAHCPTYTLNDYCAGSGCKPAGVNFSLTKKD